MNLHVVHPVDASEFKKKAALQVAQLAGVVVSFATQSIIVVSVEKIKMRGIIKTEYISN